MSIPKEDYPSVLKDVHTCLIKAGFPSSASAIVAAFDDTRFVDTFNSDDRFASLVINLLDKMVHSPNSLAMGLITLLKDVPMLDEHVFRLTSDAELLFTTAQNLNSASYIEISIPRYVDSNRGEEFIKFKSNLSNI